MKRKRWVCVSCGAEWRLPINEEPERDDYGHVVCHDCLERARQAGLPSPVIEP